MIKKKLIIILPIVVGVILIAAIVYLIFQNKNLHSQIADLQSITATPAISIVTDETAVASATASVVGKTATATATATATDDQLISEALGTKLSTTASNLDVTISKKSESAAYGSVNVKGENSGGWFVAVKDGGNWTVIADGNGTIDCALMDQYNVPNTVVGECYDSVTDQSKTR
jgi:branched-subunit amino acid transport protein AzlD